MLLDATEAGVMHRLRPVESLGSGKALILINFEYIQCTTHFHFRSGIIMMSIAKDIWRKNTWGFVIFFFLSLRVVVKWRYMSCLNPPETVSERIVRLGRTISTSDIFRHLRQRSKIVGSSPDIFDNVRKSLVNLRKSRYSEDENLTHLTQEKLAGNG